MTFTSRRSIVALIAASVVGFFGLGLSCIALLGTALGTTITCLVVIATYIALRRRGTLTPLPPHVTSINTTRLSIILAIGFIATLVISQLNGGWVDHALGDDYTTSRANETKGMAGWELGLLLLDGVILAPIIEEMICRSIIYRYMRVISSLLTSTIVSSLIFMAMHGDPTQMSYTFFSGVILALIYDATRSLRVSIIAHAVLNLASVAFNISDLGRHAPGALMIVLNIVLVAVLSFGVVAVRAWSLADEQVVEQN